MQRNITKRLFLLAVLLLPIQCAKTPSTTEPSSASSKPSVQEVLSEDKITSLQTDDETLQTGLRDIRDGQKKLDDHIDDTECTALHRAVAFGKEALVHALLKLGATPNTEDTSGETPLHTAAINGYKKIAAALIQAGAKLDEQNNDGDTPLHLAAAPPEHNGDDTSCPLPTLPERIEVVQLLVQAGAQVDILNERYKTPVDLAKEDQIKKLLASAAKKK